jgi:peptide/nickel transport system permease protein
MLGFVLRRLLISIPILFLSSILVFIMVANAGDPLGDLKGRNPKVPANVIKAREHEMGLDQPIVDRYSKWVTHFVRGDFGKSFVTQIPVRSELFKRLKITLRMVLLAVFLAIVLAVTVGVVSAVRQYTISDYASTFFSFLFLATPVFWLAALLKIFLAVKLNTAFHKQIVYTVGEQTPNLHGSFMYRFWNQAGHLALPTIALALISFATWSRFQRSSMLDVLNSDYIRLARAKGVPRRKVLIKHALRNALIPVVTVVSIDFAGVFGGAIITEFVFGWKGMGDYFIVGIQTVDINVVLAWLMITAVIVVVFNLIADVVYGLIDPRIRYA